MGAATELEGHPGFAVRATSLAAVVVAAVGFSRALRRLPTLHLSATVPPVIATSSNAIFPARQLPWRGTAPGATSLIAPVSASSPLPLELQGLRKVFRAGIPGCSVAARVLEAVDLEVRPGEVVGIAGGVGAGKTALLLCAAGLLRPDDGVVSCFGLPPGHAACAPGLVAYLAVRSAAPCLEVERALLGGARLVLLDDANPMWLEGRMVAVKSELAARGSALVIAWREGVALATVTGRTLVLRGGRLCGDLPAAPPADTQRNRSAARARSALPSAVARSSIRSTCGRSFRSPQ